MATWPVVVSHVRQNIGDQGAGATVVVNTMALLILNGSPRSVIYVLNQFY